MSIKILIVALGVLSSLNIVAGNQFNVPDCLKYNNLGQCDVCIDGLIPHENGNKCDLPFYSSEKNLFGSRSS